MTIYYRSNWKAKPNKGSLVRMKNLNKIVIHHAAGYDDANASISEKRVREIQKLHQEERGWNDIGYHFLIDSKGCIYQGRDFYGGIQNLNKIPDFIHGAHVKYANSDKIGICLLGCFHPPEGTNCKKELKNKSFDALVELCHFICSRYKLKANDILMHQDLRPSDCPGNNIKSRMKDLRTAVKAQLLLD